ncbi:MAG: hypothetical protein CLLPBCKN_008388 [Chroococcidiopsis cubana SAG 39.79]|nr:hypothetical protein [Chroococcidiopsis cubana SAG 39.79]PSB42435.1 hypothetical protein C7B80_27500 [Cyanosarcina cf. burmensis CCALA 770]PSB61851.1 hypothetical protein C7B79_20405 [Chroococcidiopsis cubana CCALA 043]PSM46108.1 hypothetical protein C7Y66_26785 [Chroococcidiopsis sp. CCALA 051]
MISVDLRYKKTQSYVVDNILSQFSLAQLQSFVQLLLAIPWFDCLHLSVVLNMNYTDKKTEKQET